MQDLFTDLLNLNLKIDHDFDKYGFDDSVPIFICMS